MFTNITLYRYTTDVNFKPDDYHDPIQYMPTVMYRLHKRNRNILLYVNTSVGPELHRIIKIHNRYLPILAEEVLGKEDNDWLEKVRHGIVQRHVVSPID